MSSKDNELPDGVYLTPRKECHDSISNDSSFYGFVVNGSVNSILELQRNTLEDIQGFLEPDEYDIIPNEDDDSEQKPYHIAIKKDLSNERREEVMVQARELFLKHGFTCGELHVKTRKEFMIEVWGKEFVENNLETEADIQIDEDLSSEYHES